MTTDQIHTVSTLSGELLFTGTERACDDFIEASIADYDDYDGDGFSPSHYVIAVAA